LLLNNKIWNECRLQSLLHRTATAYWFGAFLTMMNLLNSTTRVFCVAIALSATALFGGPALAAGPAKIKWIKMCQYEKASNHSRWIMGLTDGAKVWSFYNPSQGRAGAYSMALSAYMAGKNIHYENAEITSQIICGETATHYFDVYPGLPGMLMIGDR